MNNKFKVGDIVRILDYSRNCCVKEIIHSPDKDKEPVYLLDSVDDASPALVDVLINESYLSEVKPNDTFPLDRDKLITLYALINLADPKEFMISDYKEYLVSINENLLKEAKDPHEIFKMQCRVEDIRMDGND